jgi:hypothetical protein
MPNAESAYHPVDSWASIDTRWDRRAQMAAQWLGDARSVADVGCGTMALKDYLPKDVAYQGLDVAARDPSTLVVDLNASPLPPLNVDLVMALGVIEYLYDPRAFLGQLTAFKRSVVSYNYQSLKDWAWKLKLKPKAVNWQNHLSEAAFRRLIRDAGLDLLRRRPVRWGEGLYELAPSAGPRSAMRSNTI